MAAVLRISFEYLDALPANEVPLYGVASLERQATDLRRAAQLFLLPAEALGGGNESLTRINEEICRMSGAEVEAVAANDASNPFAELDRKYLHDLADAAKLGDWELIDRLEAAYALEASEISQQRQQQIAGRLDQIEVNMDPLIWEKLKAKAKRRADEKQAEASSANSVD